MEEQSIGIFVKIIRLFMMMKNRDLLLIGFVGLLFISIGTLTGYVPSPLLTMARQHQQLITDHEESKKPINELIEIAKLQLYLAKESCMHTAQTESEKTRCDRQSIRDAITLDENVSSFSYIADGRSLQ